MLLSFRTSPEEDQKETKRKAVKKPGKWLAARPGFMYQIQKK